MNERIIRVLDFDHSVRRQKTLLAGFAHEIIDLTFLGPRVRYWMDSGAMAQLDGQIARLKKNAVTFLGSGDFHHVSERLISRFEEPLCVIAFDHHPDWSVLPAHRNCGSWVSRVVWKKNVLKTVLLGNASEDLGWFEILTGNLSALKDDRLEIYPYEHASTKVFFKKIPSNRSIKVKKGGIFASRLHWTELKNQDLAGFLQGLLARLPTRKVYVSIDKDCLQGSFAVTNWEEGKMTLDELLLMLKLIKENAEIIGADITGDYSPIRLTGAFKQCMSSFDHPKNLKVHTLTESDITSINEKTNLKILQVLNAYE